MKTKKLKYEENNFKLGQTVYYWKHGELEKSFITSIIYHQCTTTSITDSVIYEDKLYRDKDYYTYKLDGETTEFYTNRLYLSKLEAIEDRFDLNLS